MAKAIGIDIGGTFIDLVISDESGLRLHKFSSTPDAPERGVIHALAALRNDGDLVLGEVERIAHGSTVATNALLEGDWSKTALITTRGFRDVLEIGRQNRPELYNLDVERPSPIASRDCRLECNERLDAVGAVLVPLQQAELEELCNAVRSLDVQTLAVVFLFSYLNPSHEQAVGATIAEHVGIPVTLSSDVLPEFREYERTSTTVVCASLRPVIERYLRVLERNAVELGIAPEWQIMQSNGTVISSAQAQKEPVRILLSGPAAGVQGAKSIGKLMNAPDLITLDMGGTSCDVALIRDHEIGQTTTGSVGQHPVAVRMNEIHTIGAGGGSIGWIDSGGALRVGPQSAGAVPGPACYGRGGVLPTVSDAHAVLGRLVEDAGMGGLNALDVNASRTAIEALATPLALTIEETALGILDVANAAMERAVRVISVERGYDPRDFALLAFGGAGPLHAVDIARRLSIPRVIVPAAAGVLSAMGLLTSEVGRDYGRSVLRPMDSIKASDLQSLLADLDARGVSELESEGIASSQLRREISADLRYLGQSHELSIRWELPAGWSVSPEDLARLVDAFHAEHESRFGHASLNEGVELVTVRLRMTAPPAHPAVRLADDGARSEESSSMAWFSTEGPVRTRIIDRRGLSEGDRVTGPALLWGSDATLLVPPDTAGLCDSMGTLILETT